jgi:hypothetical protein
MNATAANLMERVLPETGLRQWVLTFPFPWRRRLAQDGVLLGKLTRTFVETVQGFYAARVAGAGAPGAKTGSVTVGDVLERTVKRFERYLCRRGLLRPDEDDDDPDIPGDPEANLAASAVSGCVPPPRLHTVRYAGVLAGGSQWRSRITPAPPEAGEAEAEPEGR